MKKILLLAIITFANFAAFSQNSTEAKKLLDEVAAKVEIYENIEIEFNHSLDNLDADVHQETRGNAILQGDLYNLNYMGTEQIFDGKKVYLIIHEDEEVIIQAPSDGDDTLTPSKMFSFYKSGYTYAMGTLETINGVKIQYVELIPIDTNSEIGNIKVGVDVKSKHIYNIIETGKNNTITTLEVRSFKTNQTLSEKLFTFDLSKYKDQKKYTISEPN